MVYLTPTDALWYIFGDKEDTHVQIKLGKECLSTTYTPPLNTNLFPYNETTIYSHTTSITGTI